jgi:hypothetical protein
MKSKTGFTPGPWEAIRGEVIGGDGSRVSLAPDGFSTGSSYEHPERKANLTLCIAAPDLYMIMKDAVDSYDEPGCVVNWNHFIPLFRAALAKATK